MPMKVTKIEVEYYKSIQRLVIDLPDLPGPSEYGDSAAIFLLGVNESGKSNILEAIEALGSGFGEDATFGSVINRSIRGEEPLEKLGPISIRAHLSPSNEDKDFFHQKIEKLFRTDETTIPNEIPDLAIDYGAVSYVLSLDRDGNQSREFKIKMGDNSSAISGYTYSKGEGFKKCEPGQSSNVAPADLKDIIINELQADLKSRMPSITAWKPRPKDLMQDEIPLMVFKDDTSISKPLTNIFHMYGMRDDQQIREEINAALGDLQRMTALQRGLSRIATNHIHSTWPELKEREIEFDVNVQGDILHVFVGESKDKGMNQQRYGVGDRSSGFRQFCSLLLSLSADQILQNQIILLDEPDTYMHPGATKKMMEEIVKIGKKNHVLVATHSPYMIDMAFMERYRIVKKETINKITSTTIHPVKQKDFSGEIFKSAFGLNILEEILPGTAIFVEGKSDKEWIEFIITKFNCVFPYGTAIIPLHGAGNAKSLTEFMEYHKKKAHFLFDNNGQGRKVESVIRKNTPQFTGEVWLLSDLIKDLPSEATIEDLVPENILKAYCEKFRIDWPTDSSKMGIFARIKKNNQDKKHEMNDFKMGLVAEFKKNYSSDGTGDYQKLHQLVKRLIEEIQKINDNGSTS